MTRLCHWQEAFATAADATLDDKNFDRLNKLIEQTNAYSQFLTENMTEAEENVMANTTAAGTKRKAGKQAGRSTKRAKADAKPLTETQVGTDSSHWGAESSVHDYYPACQRILI